MQQNDEKTLSTIQSNLIQENENQLIKEEEELIAEEKILKDKLLQINLIYKKIMENAEFFIKKMKINFDKIKEEKIIIILKPVHSIFFKINLYIFVLKLNYIINYLIYFNKNS